MNKYTVIAFNESTGKIVNCTVEAKDKSNAFWVAAQNNPELTYIASLEGEFVEGQGIEFAGDSTVTGETILEQQELYNPTTYNHAFEIAFSLKGSKCRSALDVSAKELKQALLSRIADLEQNPNEFHEAVGAPFDTYEED